MYGPCDLNLPKATIADYTHTARRLKFQVSLTFCTDRGLRRHRILFMRRQCGKQWQPTTAKGSRTVNRQAKKGQ